MSSKINNVKLTTIIESPQNNVQTNIPYVLDLENEENSNIRFLASYYGYW